MAWTELGAIIGIVGCVSGGLYWVLYQKMTCEFDKRYMTTRSCEDKHKVTDTMIAGMREDLSEIKEAVQKIHEVIYNAMRLR